MISFKQYLKEYLTPEQKDRYKNVAMTPAARQATDHVFGVGNDQVREELKGFEADKSETHRKIEKHLGQSISLENYKAGMSTDKYGRSVKLGKLITDPQLRDEFNRDNTRAGVKKQQKHYVTLVRGTEVAGQTNSASDPAHPKGHSWGGQSCKNVDTGCNRHYLGHEIMHGTVVMRVHDPAGQEIYRATLQPHLHEEGDTAYSVDAEYGIKHPSFTAHAQDAAMRLSGPYKPGSYAKHPLVYNDNQQGAILHPAASEENLHEHLDDIKNPKPLHRLSAAVDLRYIAGHPEAGTSVIDRLFAEHSGNRDVLVTAMKNPRASAANITLGLNHPNPDVAIQAAKHPNVSQEHVDDLLQNPANFSIVKTWSQRDHLPHHVEHVASTHPGAVKHVDRLMNDPNAPSRIKEVLMLNPHISSAHVEKGMADPNFDVRRAAIGNRNATQQQLDRVLKNEKEDSILRARAARNPSLSDNQMDYAFNHDKDNLRFAVITNPGAQRRIHDWLDKADSNKRHEIFLYAPKLSESHLDRGLADPDIDVRGQAIRHNSIQLHHLERAAASDPHPLNRGIARNIAFERYGMTL